MPPRHLLKKTSIVICSRVIKLLANIGKLASYPFHALLPKVRFTLPEQAAPWWPSKQASCIPRIIWQTNFTNRVTLPVYLNYLFNRLMAPRFEYRFMITQARRGFIEAHCDVDVLACYDRLQIGAAQADLWRLAVLDVHGGVYLDIDAHAIWPLGDVIGEEVTELYVTTRRGDLSNYFIASQPGNLNIQRLLAQVCANIRENRLTNVFDITGPGVFNALLDQNEVPTIAYRYACNQGSFTNEHFQYIDKAAGKWTREQKQVRVIRDEP